MQIITNKNLNDFIEIPSYIYDKIDKNIINMAHFSDILRVMLLNEYGGIWIDATVYLTKNIPNDILSTDFFAFHARNTGNHFIENWFLKAKKNDILISTTKNFLLEYWKNEKMPLITFSFIYF